MVHDRTEGSSGTMSGRVVFGMFKVFEVSEVFEVFEAGGA
jgi:hypothetical protein